MTVVPDEHRRLDSVGIVCPCGRPLATMELVAKPCEGCGRIWLVSATLLRGPTCPPTDYAHGAHFDIHRELTP